MQSDRWSFPELVLGNVPGATSTMSLAGTPTASRTRSATSRRRPARSSALDSATTTSVWRPVVAGGDGGAGDLQLADLPVPQRGPGVRVDDADLQPGNGPAQQGEAA